MGSIAVARRMWQLFEPVHAVTYFAPEAAAAAERLGLRGFWAGYVVFRAAPLGPVGPAPVTAAFFGFAPTRAERVLPDAWSVTTPDAALAARCASAAAALRRVAPVEDVAIAADLAWQAAQSCESPGRVLAAANRALARPDDPLEALWQASTTLREHRGDGHLAALLVAGLGPVESQLLKVAAGEAPGDQLQKGRAWSDEEWQTGVERLRARGLLDGEQRLTTAGVELRDQVEQWTDAAAIRPWDALGPSATERLVSLLLPMATAVVDSGTVPMASPIGLAARPV